MSGVTRPAQFPHRHPEQCRPAGRFRIDLPPGSRIRKVADRRMSKSQGTSALRPTLTLPAPGTILREVLGPIQTDPP
jgi:hypothetical protein